MRLYEACTQWEDGQKSLLLWWAGAFVTISHVLSHVRHTESKSLPSLFVTLSHNSHRSITQSCSWTWKKSKHDNYTEKSIWGFMRHAPNGRMAKSLYYYDELALLWRSVTFCHAIVTQSQSHYHSSSRVCWPISLGKINYSAFPFPRAFC